VRKAALWHAFVAAIVLSNSYGLIPQESPVTRPPIRPAYLNPHLPADARVADLLSRMTLEEKVGQLEAPLGWEMYQRAGDAVEVSQHFKKMMADSEPGTLYGVLRADPWTRVTLKTGLSPRQAAEAVNAIQKYAVTHSRLHIPLLLAEECTHGHMAIGATTFPTAIGQASTWDPALIESMEQAVAEETRASGANNCYAPMFNLGREQRWSRVEETYGEDPYLTARMATANVQGFQGAGLASQKAISSTLKTYLGYGVPEGGHNSGPVDAGQHEIQTVFLPPFRAGVAAGASSIMAAYNAIDSVPCVGNHWLLTGVLRGQLHFNGFVVSDLYAIDGLVGTHHVAANNEQAATLSLNAGVDSDLGANAFPQLVKAVKEGRVSREAIDRAAARILRVKFQLGLFESPYADPERAEKVTDDKAHRALARQVARESIVLLKNAGGLLPLSRHVDSIAVIGPNADSVYNQLGDYTAPQPENKVVTVLQAIRAAVGPGTVVRYAKGTSIRGTSEAGFGEALEAVRKSKVAVVVLGGSSARDFNTSYAATGAANPRMDANGADMDSGEGFDRATLNLAGVQLKLLQQIVATGKPVVLVLIEGRPLEMTWAAASVPAILNAWYPGEAGGLAIADVLFGDYDPAGRLPISVPRAVGQLPVYYGSPRPDYIEMKGSPQFAFGFGLSYTTFKYTNLRAALQQSDASVTADVTVDISNTGTRSGDEVAQLYLHPVTSSVITPMKALRGFQRIHLDPGQTRRVTFHLKPEDLAVFNQKGQWIVEPGTFDVMVGGASDDIRGSTQFVVSRPLPIQ
jgi:beta-glucosidase